MGDGVVGCGERLVGSGVGTGILLEQELVLESMLGLGVIGCSRGDSKYIS